jgi:hypothetical protein
MISCQSAIHFTIPARGKVAMRRGSHQLGFVSAGDVEGMMAVGLVYVLCCVEHRVHILIGLDGLMGRWRRGS